MAFTFTKYFARFGKRAKALSGGDPSAVALYSDRVLSTPVESLLDPSFFARPTGPDEFDLNRPAPRFESPVSLGRLTADRLGPPPGWGVPELRETVAERWGCDADDVLVTRGASGAFAAALDAFVNPGDPVVVFDPGPPLFSIGAANRRAQVRRVPEVWNRAAFRRAVADAKMVCVSVPNNPSGRVFPADAMNELVTDTARAGAILYLDSTFDLDGKLPTGTRILRAGSVSSLGLSGLRVGWLTGTPGLLRPCALAQAMAGPFVPAVCQQLAARVLSEPDFVSAEAVAARRTWAAEQLRRSGFETDDSGDGFFLWVRVAPLKFSGRHFADRLRAECGVVVGPGDLFGPSGKDFVRVSVAADDGRVREGLARIAAFVAKVTGKPDVVSARVRVGVAVEEREPVFSRV